MAKRSLKLWKRMKIRQRCLQTILPQWHRLCKLIFSKTGDARFTYDPLVRDSLMSRLSQEVEIVSGTAPPSPHWVLGKGFTCKWNYQQGLLVASFGPVTCGAVGIYHCHSRWRGRLGFEPVLRVRLTLCVGWVLGWYSRATCTTVC